MRRILKKIALLKLNFDAQYESYRNKDYLYNFKLIPVESSKIENIKEKVVPPKYPNAKDLNLIYFSLIL